MHIMYLQYESDKNVSRLMQYSRAVRSNPSSWAFWERHKVQFGAHW